MRDRFIEALAKAHGLRPIPLHVVSNGVGPDVLTLKRIFSLPGTRRYTYILEANLKIIREEVALGFLVLHAFLVTVQVRGRNVRNMRQVHSLRHFVYWPDEGVLHEVEVSLRAVASAV